MNKIVLIGNGFDLAHNLPTRYVDFLNHIKDSIVKKVAISSNRYRHEISGQTSKRDRSYIHKLDNQNKEDPWLGAKINPETYEIVLEPNPHAKVNSIYYKSLISDESLNGYWSDLEFHYFKTLNEHSGKQDAVSTINEEFDHLKSLLFSYLKHEVEDKVGTAEEFIISDNHSIFQMLLNGHSTSKFNHHFYVNFNYTSKIIDQYASWLKDREAKKTIPSLINIHGDLTNPSNPIIFGYGDDNSDDYRHLQDLQDNTLLKNFKTFQYLRSVRYRQVLGLLETDKEIYVQIIGHSCGISDKALLRTIFQHPNVKHIEATYHEAEERYFEKLYNISRIFDDNSLMREKLIPLEQTFMVE